MNCKKGTMKYKLNNVDGISLELLRKQLQHFSFEEITSVYDWNTILKDLDFDKINASIAVKGYDSLALYLDWIAAGGFCHFSGIPTISKEELVKQIKIANDELTVADLFLILLQKKEEKTNKIIKDTDIYKTACVNKDVYSRFINMRFHEYHPSKSTLICLALALELTVDEFQNFMNTAGYYMKKNNEVDSLILFFVENDFYDVLKINEWICELCGKNKAIVKPPREEKPKDKHKTWEQNMVDFCEKYGVDVLHTDKGDMTVINGKLKLINQKKIIETADHGKNRVGGYPLFE